MSHHRLQQLECGGVRSQRVVDGGFQGEILRAVSDVSGGALYKHVSGSRGWVCVIMLRVAYGDEGTETKKKSGDDSDPPRSPCSDEGPPLGSGGTLGRAGKRQHNQSKQAA